ncbi:RagB/SusD family nutrient uptake outer membrane protein [Pedobacter sp. L105]|uniref:RagB/SusD family nutrient uptake outer membrane protein n=1 Tax=Pedobacter sp. L105 TaxID=1641871 RepID=UPI00131DC1EA|nr:RagB/SusD family nutrient uptake outer membrane protein [Pedobacter sp. L105]
MKTHKLLLLLFVFTFLFSCQKYLEEKSNSTQVFITTASQCQLLLDAYNTMNSNYPNDQVASSDDYYLHDGDLALQPGDDQNIYKWSSNAVRSTATEEWTDPYYIVYNANLVLEAIEKLKGGTTDLTVLSALRGSALFYRSYAFWHIAQLYTKTYTGSTANQDSGIPLRLSSDLNGVSTRGTVQQTYDQIIQDLKEAATLLPPTPSITSRPSKEAAYAMLSRIYLSMGNYTDALSNASSVLNINAQLMDFNNLDPSTDFPFTRFNKEVLFHSYTISAQITSANYALMDSTVASSYQTNDLRKSIYLKSYNGGYYFTGNYEPNTYTNLFNGLAIDEVYLTRAECYARSGNITAAMADLNTLLITRWKTGSYVAMAATTADDALSQILTERRKELLMRGVRWMDLKRLNTDSRFAVTLKRVINNQTYTLPPNDLRYVLEIPDPVIKNSSIPQNPR